MFNVIRSKFWSQHSEWKALLRHRNLCAIQTMCINSAFVFVTSFAMHQHECCRIPLSKYILYNKWINSLVLIHIQYAVQTDVLYTFWFYMVEWRKRSLSFVRPFLWPIICRKVFVVASVCAHAQRSIRRKRRRKWIRHTCKKSSSSSGRGNNSLLTASLWTIGQLLCNSMSVPIFTHSFGSNSFVADGYLECVCVCLCAVHICARESEPKLNWDHFPAFPLHPSIRRFHVRFSFRFASSFPLNSQLLHFSFRVKCDERTDGTKWESERESQSFRTNEYVKHTDISAFKKKIIVSSINVFLFIGISKMDRTSTMRNCSEFRWFDSIETEFSRIVKELPQ